MKQLLVTGGAGFIGSHLVDALITRGNNVSVFDNLTNGTLQNIKQWLNHSNFTFIKGDLLNPADIKKLNHNQCNIIFHLAVDSEVKRGSANPNIHFQQNITVTCNLLETIRKTQNQPHNNSYWL